MSLWFQFRVLVLRSGYLMFLVLNIVNEFFLPPESLRQIFQDVEIVTVFELTSFRGMGSRNLPCCLSAWEDGKYIVNYTCELVGFLEYCNMS